MYLLYVNKGRIGFCTFLQEFYYKYKNYKARSKSTLVVNITKYYKAIKQSIRVDICNNIPK